MASFLSALSELHDTLVASLSSCGLGLDGVEAKPELMRSVVMLPSAVAAVPFQESSAAVVQQVEIESRRGARQAAPPEGLQLFFPGFKWETALVKLSCAELAVYCFEHLLSAGTPTVCTLVQLGASWAPAICSGHVWRLVVPIFLHGNLGHVLTNVLFQMRLGFKVEESLGRWSFVSLYLLSGTFGNLVSAALQPAKVAVGASTSAMGVLGATVVRLLCEEQGPEKQAMLISSFLILVFINLSPHADLFGHLGGFLSGVCLSLCLKPSSSNSLRFWSVVPMLAAGGICGYELSVAPHAAQMAEIAQCPALWPGVSQWLHNFIGSPAATVATATMTARL